MATKQQKLKIPIDPRYSRSEKQAIAQDIIDHIYKRTVVKRKDKDGKKLAGYSKGYAQTPEGKIAGKKRDKPANLKLTGDMMNALGEYQRIGKSYIEIGFKKGSEENAKAEGNILGTYGNKLPLPGKARDFLGITDIELSKILKEYPTGAKDNSIAKALAKTVAAKVTTDEN